MASMPRLAWFTPLPPERSGIATYNAELLPLLAETHEIDVFVERSRPAPNPQPPVPSPQPPDPSPQICDAHDFLWKHHRHPYDLIVYQLGNAICHDYMWPYLFRWPGLVILHDAQLHHARARWLLRQNRRDDYCAEFAYNHPDARPEIAELGVAGLLGPLHYLWPMIRAVVRSARVVAVHNERLATDLREQGLGCRIEAITMGVADRAGGRGAVARSQGSRAWGYGSEVGGQGSGKQGELRRFYGIAPDAIVFAAFGRVTPEKRIPQALGAVAAVARTIPNVHLLLVGQTADYYDAAAEASALGLADHVTLTGYVEDAELPAYIAAADVCLCLRWPSSRETSGSWLRCLAAGKPTIITDLVHTVDVPALDPRSWTVNYARQGSGLRNRTPSPQLLAPICTSIDILDEDHSLKLAIQRLAVDAKLREQLGNPARRFWEKNHTIERMVADYRRVIDIALTSGAPTQERNTATELPAHLLSDGTEHARALLREMGVSADVFVKQ